MKNVKIYMIRLLKNIFYFFPIQLVLLHLRKNIFLLLLWGILFGILLLDFGAKLGIPYLFLDPEYLGEINYKSTFLVGFFIALFIGAFNITSYILDGYRFIFLAYSKRPFINFSLNNSLIPFAFIGVYIYRFYSFQNNYESQNLTDVYLEIFAFILGIIVVSATMFFYFNYMNKNWFKMLAGNINLSLKKNKYNRSVVMQKIADKRTSKNRVDYYYSFPSRIEKVDTIIPYKKEHLMMVFDQNHLNAMFFQIFIFFIIFTLLIFDRSKFFQFPAAISISLVLTVITMIVGFIYYWFKKWYLLGMVLLAIIINFLYGYEIINKRSKLDSLDYTVSQQFYKEDLLIYDKELNKSSDSLATIHMLENWKSKYQTKPKMVVICVSGGGLRASKWSFDMLENLDKEMKGNFFNQSVLITGASGGMIGAGYFREVYLKRSKNELKDKTIKDFSKNLSEDLLNAIALKMLLHDPIGRISSLFQTVDRAQAFENKFNENTNFILQKSVKSYHTDVQNASIPMMILAPTIAQNSYKMFISEMGVSYMVHEDLLHENLNGIEYKSYFKENEKYSLNFVTALRLSASFPYITPFTYLPTQPLTSTTDAGVSDTYGVKDAVNFLEVFKDWINKNTSGVVVINIRDSEKNSHYKQFVRKTAPFESVYDKYFDMQDLYNDQLLISSKKWLVDLEQINFEYIVEDDKNKSVFSRKAALNWHLTNLEKENISNSIGHSKNIESLLRLKNILKNQIESQKEK